MKGTKKENKLTVSGGSETQRPARGGCGPSEPRVDGLVPESSDGPNTQIALRPDWSGAVADSNTTEEATKVAEMEDEDCDKGVNLARRIITDAITTEDPLASDDVGTDPNFALPGVSDSEGSVHRDQQLVGDVVMIDDDDDDEDIPPPTPNRDKRKARFPSDSPENTVKPLKRRYTTSENEIYTPVPTAKHRLSIQPVAANNLRSYDSDKLNKCATECLQKMETIRNSSKNIKGNFSGYLRDGISNIGEILDIYRERLGATGDVADLELQNRNLTTQLRKVTREQELQKKEYSILRKENEDLRKDMEMLRKEIKNMRDTANMRGSPSKVSEINSADARKISTGEPLTRVEDFPPLPQRKPRVISSEILRDRTVKLSKYPTSASGSETDAIPSSYKKRSPSGGNRRTDREANVVHPEEDTDSYHMLESMNQQIQQLVANMEVLRARFGSKSEEPSKKKRVKKTSFRNDTETSGVLDGEFMVPRTPALPIEATTRKEGSRRGASGDAPPRSTTRSRRPPKTAAVSITSLKDDVSYADILKKARENINLDTLGIETSKIRRGINGGIIIEIPGADGTTKADSLVGKLREVLDVNNIRITRPTTMGELRIWSFDDSISPTEILNEVSVVGDCDEHLVKLGNIRKMNNGLNSVWVKCPLSAAIKISATNKIKIGWTIARVELLEARPVQCFKCWRYGHVRTTCNFPEDRTGACFRCGERGHQIGDCREDPRCVICMEAGRPSDHRLGSLNICTSVELIRGRRREPVSDGRATARR